MWQAEADSELTLSALPATAVGQIVLTMAKFCQYVHGNAELKTILSYIVSKKSQQRMIFKSHVHIILNYSDQFFLLLRIQTFRTLEDKAGFVSYPRRYNHHRHQYLVNGDF